MIIDTLLKAMLYSAVFVEKVQDNYLNFTLYVADSYHLQILPDFEWLCGSQKNKMDKYLLDEDKKTLIASELIILRGIMDICNINNPQEVLAFYLNHNRKVGEYGKPYFDNVNFEFNISHSGRYSVGVFSDHDIGVDIEKVDNMELDIADKYLTKYEYMEIAKLRDTEKQLDKMTEYWVKKESYVKAIGKGLNVPLRSVSFYKLFTDIYIVNPMHNDKVYLIEALRAPNHGYKLAVCKKTEIDKCFLKKYMD